MGDASPCNELSLGSSEQSGDGVRLLIYNESESSFQDLAWLSLPTAFYTITTTIHDMKDGMPARPISPTSEARAGLELRSVTTEAEPEQTSRTAPPVAQVQLRLLSEEESSLKPASTKLCAICSVDLMATDPNQRVKHFDKCWSTYHLAVVTNKSKRRRFEPSHPIKHSEPHRLAKEPHTLKHRLAKICISCNASMESLCSVDTFEHRMLCLSSLQQLPTACARCKTSFVTSGMVWDIFDIAEHIHVCSVRDEGESFKAAQAAWYDRQLSRKDPSNCAFCSKGLKGLDVIDVFHHRRNCLQQRRVQNCPVCFKPPSSSTGDKGWSLDDTLWHVHDCQHDNSLSVIDKNDFDAVAMRWQGRMSAVWRMNAESSGVAIGKRKGWSRNDHRRSYRGKQERWRDKTNGIYLFAASKLRHALMYAEQDAMRVVRNMKSNSVISRNIESFRRSAYTVYQAPELKDIVDWHAIEYQIEESIDKATVDSVAAKELVVQSEDDECMPTDASSSDDGNGHRREQMFDGRLERRIRRWSSHHSQHLAFENARRAGIPIPPGFELPLTDEAEMQPSLVLNVDKSQESASKGEDVLSN